MSQIAPTLSNKPLIVVAAGGTGGHMVPAHAVAERLRAQGFDVALMTDERGLKYPGLFGGVETHVLASGTLNGGLKGKISGVRSILAGTGQARRLMQSRRPAVVVGFGGYPALPALLAAISLRIPVAIHEQNAVLGRVNRLLARFTTLIATSFKQTQRLKAGLLARTVLTGNPVRQEILALRDLPYPEFSETSAFRILVIGGSQGAKILADVVPAAIDLLPADLKRRVRITQQCREADLEPVKKLYSRVGIAAECSAYITDMADKLRWSHLVIARAGASTLSELTAVGRPSILVPLPSAMDDHQTANARDVADAGGARLIPQAAFTPEALAEAIMAWAASPATLLEVAAKAKAAGQPEAAAHLAGLISRIADKTSNTGDAFAPANTKAAV